MKEEKTRSRLHIGTPAPDIALSNVQGEIIRLADLWQNGPTLLTFLRHFG